MREIQHRHLPHAHTPSRAQGGLGADHGSDRSHLLRRRSRPPSLEGNGSDSLRLKRSRRVCGSFSAIPDLSRAPTV